MLKVAARGFTLIELVVVLVIMAMLSALAIPSFASVIDRSQLLADKIELQAFATSQAGGAILDGAFSTKGFEASVAAPWSLSTVSTKVYEASHGFSADRSSASIAALSTSGDVCLSLEVSISGSTSIVEEKIHRPGDICQASGDLGETNPPAGPGTPVTPTNPTDPTNPPDSVLNAPTVVSVAKNAAALSARVNWSRSVGAEDFIVERSANQSPWLEVGVAKEATFEDSALTPGASYVYRVIARSGEKTTPSPASNTITFAPAPPLGLSGEKSGSTLSLSWAASFGATSYSLFRDGALVGVTSNTSLPLELIVGSRSNFTVLATNAGGQSTTSPPYVYNFLTAAPVLNAQAGPGKAMISWPAVPGASGYDLEFSSSGLANDFSPVASTKELSFEHTGLTPLTKYFYRASAASPAGRALSNVVEVTPLAMPTPPALPVLVGSLDGLSASLSWVAVPEAVSYRLYRDGVFVKEVAGTSTSILLPAGLTSSLTLRAVGSNTLVSADSNAVILTTVPSAPVISGSIAGSVTTIAWDPVPGASVYVVSSKNRLQVGPIWIDGALTSTNMTQNSFTLTPELLTNQIVYVQARNSAGTSLSSNILLVAPGLVQALSTPVTPTDVQATSNANQVKVSWTRSAYSTNYNIYGNGVLLGTVGDVNEFNYTIPPGNPVTFTVVGTNLLGVSPVSAGANITPIPAAVTNLKVSASGSSAVLIWDAAVGATSYQVSINGAAPITLPSPNYTATNLARGTNHTFKVIALNAQGASTAVNTALTLPLPAPTNVKHVDRGAVLTIRTLAVSWDRVPGASSYSIRRDGITIATVNNSTTLTYTDTILVSLGSPGYYEIAGVSSDGTIGEYGRSVPATS